MRYLNIIGEINESVLENILDRIKEFKEEELDFIDTLTEDDEFTEEEAIQILGPITINISTFGGIVDCGFAILDALSTLASPIHTRANGYCMSTGLALFLSGEHRECGKHTTFMYHTIAYGVEGHLAKHKAQVEASKEIQQMYDNLIIKNTQITDKHLKKYTHSEWYISANKALELGLVHEIN